MPDQPASNSQQRRQRHIRIRHFQSRGHEGDSLIQRLLRCEREQPTRVAEDPLRHYRPDPDGFIVF